MIPRVDRLFAPARPDLHALCRAYPHWVQRADAARYLILHEYCGVYDRWQRRRARRHFRTLCGTGSLHLSRVFKTLDSGALILVATLVLIA